MLSASDRAKLIEVAAMAMPDRVRVIRPGTTEDPMGGSGSGAPTEIGEVQCAVSSYVSQAQLVGDQQRAAADLQLSIRGDATIDIRPQDRVQLLPDGQAYEVQGYPERGGRFQITKRVLVSRI